MDDLAGVRCKSPPPALTPMTKPTRIRALLIAPVFCVSLCISVSLPPTPAHAQSVALPEANGLI